LSQGNGFLARHFSPAVRVDFVSPIPVPLSIGYMYVGSGCLAIRIRPSPWLNPFASVSSSEAEARAQFSAYAAARADLQNWLRPLSGLVLVAEPGIYGAHAPVLAEILEQLANGENDSTDNDEPTPSWPDCDDPDEDRPAPTLIDAGGLPDQASDQAHRGNYHVT